MEVLVGLIAPRRYALNRFRLPVPEPVRVRALIDTGATFSCFDPSVFEQLKALPSYGATILTPGTGDVPQQMRQYDVAIDILTAQGDSLLRVEPIAAVEASLLAQGITGLIGRDILNRCLFVFDGPNATFSLSL